MALARTPGTIADLSIAAPLIEAWPSGIRLIADRGCDANHGRRMLAERGTSAVIPSTASRKTPLPVHGSVDRERNLSERMFGRLKNFRRSATRYGQLATNFLAAIAMVARAE